jgi:LPXTG-motif cell wall-anchored protein
MSLEYLSGIKRGSAPKRLQTKTVVKKLQPKALVKKVISKTPIVKKVVPKMTALVKSKINKMQVQGKIRKAFQKKAEPLKVEEEEILEEQAEPSETQVEEQASEETAEETNETEENSAEDVQQETADELGIIYPSASFGKPKGKLKAKLKKASAKVKQAGAKLKKATSLKTDKNDKHSKKDQLKHKLAKVSLAVPRGAFLSLLLLGKALEKTPIKINLAKKLAEAWNKGKKNEIIEKWYKLGGDAETLKNQINKAQSQKLNGFLGEPATTATAGTTVAVASPIVASLLAIVNKASKFAKDNPKLLAVGQKIAKDGLNKVQAKSGISKESLDLTKEVSNTLTENLPKDVKDAVNRVANTVTGKQAQNLFEKAKNTLTMPEEIKPRTGKSNTGILIGVGAIALIGGYMLLKKKNKNNQ